MKALLALPLLILSLSAWADRMPSPSNTPAAYREECASCHIAYPPALLAADDWRKLVSGLDRHFGSDATVDAVKKKEIMAFLERNAGNPQRLGANSEPPAISHSRWFIREHREISGPTWRSPQVKTAANCEACHRNAATGSFNEHEIRIPGGNK